jgi:hypothetical protein
VTLLTSWQAVIAVAGLVVFGYGVRADSERMRWLGIGFLVVAFAFRFVKRRQQGGKF